MKQRNVYNLVKEIYPKGGRAALVPRMQGAMNRVIHEDRHRARVSFQSQQGYVTDLELATLLRSSR